MRITVRERIVAVSVIGYGRVSSTFEQFASDGGVHRTHRRKIMWIFVASMSPLSARWRWRRAFCVFFKTFFNFLFSLIWLHSRCIGIRGPSDHKLCQCQNGMYVCMYVCACACCRIFVAYFLATNELWKWQKIAMQKIIADHSFRCLLRLLVLLVVCVAHL